MVGVSDERHTVTPTASRIVMWLVELRECHRHCDVTVGFKDCELFLYSSAASCGLVRGAARSAD